MGEHAVCVGKSRYLVLRRGVAVLDIATWVVRWGAVVFLQLPMGVAVCPKLQRMARPLLLQLGCANKIDRNIVRSEGVKGYLMQ